MTTTVSTAGDEERLVLSRCPFCGATPHRGPTKAQHDQLHGEPFQRYVIWCPHGCARIDRIDERQAAADWNNRPEAADLITRLRQERDDAQLSASLFEGLSHELDDALSASNAEAERLREALGYAAMGLDRIHTSLIGYGPKQASGEMAAHFLAKAQAALQGSAKQ